MNPITEFLDRLEDMPPRQRWLGTFGVFFAVGFVLFMVLSILPVLLGLYPASAILIGAVGCGLGTAVVNSLHPLIFLE